MCRTFEHPAQAFMGPRLDQGEVEEREVFPKGGGDDWACHFKIGLEWS